MNLFPYEKPFLESGPQCECECDKTYMQSGELEKEREFYGVKLDFLYTFDGREKKSWRIREELERCRMGTCYGCGRKKRKKG